MYKKLLAFIAGAVFSVSATAGYVQYDFVDTSSAGISSANGYFIQRDDDKAIAYFYIGFHDFERNRGGGFQPERDEGGTFITSETTHYHGDGPTSFTIADNEGEDHIAHFNIEFSPAANGNFSYLATYDFQSEYDGIGIWTAPKYSGAIGGLVTKDTQFSGKSEEFDMMGGTYWAVPHIVPTYTHFLPEPASLGLLAVGALGLGVGRRRKASR